MSLFFNDEFNPLVESLITESDDNDKDNMWDSFSSYVERKLRGFSTKEVDVLISKAKKVNSEESKRDVLKSINSAMEDARSTLKNTTDKDKKNELNSQLGILSQLSSKVKSFDPMKDLRDKESDKSDDDDDSKSRERINLDD